MEKLDNQFFDPYEEGNIESMIFQIKQYSKDYSLTARQIGEIFDEGIVVCSREEKIQLPSYHA